MKGWGQSPYEPMEKSVDCWSTGQLQGGLEAPNLRFDRLNRDR